MADGPGKEVALGALEAAGQLIETKCHVPQDHIWVVGTNHRTGSLMNNDQSTTPGQLYLALAEGLACGARQSKHNFMANGVPVRV